ncbi:MAG TPA: hypothetical protein PKM64_09050 [Thermoanaerobaculia bacterium]|nr:hypothetical protein [Thermoanaerobaculia bacterium]
MRTPYLSRGPLLAGGALLLGLLLLGAAPLAAAELCLGVSVVGNAAGTALLSDGFESGDTSAWGRAPVPAFSTAANDDLLALVDLDPALTGEHLLELRWTLAEGGELYQSVAVPFTAGEAPPGAARRVAGYPFPVPLGFAARTTLAGEASALRVTSPLPVAGTAIVDAALWGSWQVTVHLDGADEPCVAPALFHLEP